MNTVPGSLLHNPYPEKPLHQILLLLDFSYRICSPSFFFPSCYGLNACPLQDVLKFNCQCDGIGNGAFKRWWVGLLPLRFSRLCSLSPSIFCHQEEGEENSTFLPFGGYSTQDAILEDHGLSFQYAERWANTCLFIINYPESGVIMNYNQRYHKLFPLPCHWE